MLSVTTVIVLLLRSMKSVTFTVTDTTKEGCNCLSAEGLAARQIASEVKLKQSTHGCNKREEHKREVPQFRKMCAIPKPDGLVQFIEG